MRWVPRGTSLELCGLEVLFCGGAPSIDAEDHVLLADLDADSLRDTVKHLLNMVNSLEETVKLLARYVDWLRTQHAEVVEPRRP